MKALRLAPRASRREMKGSHRCGRHPRPVCLLVPLQTLLPHSSTSAPTQAALQSAHTALLCKMATQEISVAPHKQMFTITYVTDKNHPVTLTFQRHGDHYYRLDTRSLQRSADALQLWDPLRSTWMPLDELTINRLYNYKWVYHPTSGKSGSLVSSPSGQISLQGLVVREKSDAHAGKSANPPSTPAPSLASAPRVSTPHPKYAMIPSGNKYLWRR